MQDCLYDALTSNIYATLRFERPEILSRILNRSDKNVRWDKNIDHQLMSSLYSKLFQISTVKLDPDELDHIGGGS